VGNIRVRAASLRALPEGEDENSPGWSTAEPWEGVPTPAAPSRRDGRISAPHVAGIVINPVFLKKGNELSLKISLAVVLLLARNVCQRGVYLGPSNGKGSITLLPGEGFLRADFVHPVRGCALDLLHGCGYRERRRQRQKKMDVVFRSAHGERLHLVLARNAAHVGPQPRLNLRDNGLAPLSGGEDAMKQRATVGV